MERKAKIAKTLSQSDARELERRRQRIERSTDIVDAVTYWQLALMLSPSSEVDFGSEEIFNSISALTLDSSPEERAFPKATAHLIRRASALYHRARLPSMWLRITSDEELRKGDLRRTKKANLLGTKVFSSSEHLYEGLAILDAYIGPLLAALTPFLWGISAHREVGVLVYSLGRPISGTRGDAAELLQVLPNPGSAESVELPQIGQGSTTSALEWWVERLNELFAVLTDPYVYTNSNAYYVPEKHLQALATVEQLFRRVNSVQLSHRDLNARRVLLFTVLDTLDRLTGQNIETLCSLKHARETLTELRAVMPPSAAEVLLPGAERGVEALRRVQDGFFIAHSLNRNYIDVGDQQFDLERAAAAYIKVLRNATHGHGGKRPKEQAVSSALLANHDGGVPHDLGLLGYLYLLRLLTTTDSLRKRLHRGGAG